MVCFLYVYGIDFWGAEVKECKVKIYRLLLNILFYSNNKKKNEFIRFLNHNQILLSHHFNFQEPCHSFIVNLCAIIEFLSIFPHSC